MNTQIVMGLLILAVVGTVGVLGAGLITMARGKDTHSRTSNKLMWWRIYLQGGALALFALLLVLLKG
jgi:hypothetical protein